MTTTESHPNARSTPSGGVTLSCAILIGSMLLALAGVAAWAYSAHGEAGVFAALLAWMLCTSAALAALLVSIRFAGTPIAATANLATMAIRMGVPLFGALILPRLAPQLGEAGLLPSLLACYLVALVVETLLALRHVAPTSRKSLALPASAQSLEAK